MQVERPGRANGTYHASIVQRERNRRIRLLIGIGGVLSVIGIVQVLLINADMTRIEQSGPPRLALAGDALAHFVPSILSNFQRAQQPANTVTFVDPSDPRHSPAFIDDKRALERWTAFTGLALAVLLVGLQSRIPESSVNPGLPDRH